MILYLSFLSTLVYLHQYVYQYGTDLLMNNYGNISDIVLTPYKQKYIVKNIWKSCILFLIMIATSIPILDGFIRGIWSNWTFFIFGTIYVSLDLSGLIYVQGLPTATKIHHYVVCVLGTLNSMADYNFDGYYHSILIYTYFSIIPFIVNFYLGYRYLEQNQQRLKKLALISYYVYLCSLSVNVLSQFLFFITQPFRWTIVLYLLMYILIFNDDMKLIEFLKNSSTEYIF